MLERKREKCPKCKVFELVSSRKEVEARMIKYKREKKAEGKNNDIYGFVISGGGIMFIPPNSST